MSLDDLVFGKNKLFESDNLPSELVNLQSEGIWFYSGENGNIRCMYELPKDHVLYQEGVSSGIRERNFITLAVISREGNSVRLGVPGRQIILNMAPKEVIHHTRKLSKDVLELVDTALIEVENQRLEEE